MSWFKALREKEPPEPANPIGTIVIGTLYPDLIDTAKEMVRKSLKTAQFKTVDIGKSASAATFVSKAKEANADIIVNTTPLGMFPNTGAKPDINYDLLNNKHILFDLVYNPEITSFLQKGKERGCRIITGLKMLYSQADRSWEIWNNSDI